MAIRQVNADSAVAPNLVPMVDVMFLLLLFLMVGADMGDRELEEVRLPVAKTAVEDPPEIKDGGERLTLNVYHCQEGCSAYEATQLCTDRAHWAVGVRGVDFKSEGELARFLGGIAKEDCEKNHTERPENVRVLIRADQAALFEHVQTAMASCAEAKIFKVELGAATMAVEGQ